MLELHMKGTATCVVDENNTALAMGSGALRVFATPAMVALMEKAAAESVAPHLEAGQGSVGTLISVKHTAATPVGMTVRCESELVEVDGRRLVFKVLAFDEAGPIGEADHERFVVNDEKFLARTYAKLER